MAKERRWRCGKSINMGLSELGLELDFYGFFDVFAWRRQCLLIFLISYDEFAHGAACAVVVE